MKSFKTSVVKGYETIINRQINYKQRLCLLKNV